MPVGSMRSELSETTLVNSAAQCADIGSLRLCNQLTWAQQPRRKHACKRSRYGGQHDGAVEQSTFALQYLDVKFPVGAKGRQNPQRRGRRIKLGSFWAEKENWAITGLGMHLQPTQLFCARLRQPGQDGTAAWVCFHKLLGGPQPLGRRVGGNPDQVPLCDA